MKLKLWIGNTHGRPPRVLVAASSRKRAIELLRVTIGLNATEGELKNYWSHITGHPVYSQFANEEGVWTNDEETSASEWKHATTRSG
jgi:hypothetical protein